MATQPDVDLRGGPFLDYLPRESREKVLLNSTRIRYAAGTVVFQPGDADRADILDTGALSVAFGVLIAILPGAGVLAILWLIGFYSILGGVMRLVVAYRIRSAQGDVKSAVGALRPQS